MDTIKECFEIILQGDKEESRLAARRVTKLTYSREVNDKYKHIRQLVNNAQENYGKISESWRQENFVEAISVIYFLHDREAEPDFLFPWLLDLLLHPNGNIRYAVVRMFSHELGPLTVYIRIPDYKRERAFRNITPEQSDDIIFSLFVRLNDLIDKVWEPKYNRYKYIGSLPVGPYKSIQMVISELHQLCGEEYMKKLITKYQLYQLKN